MYTRNKDRMYTRTTWGKKIACTRGQIANYTRIGNGHFLHVKTNENRDWWYMGRFYLEPCVEVGGSRLCAAKIATTRE